MITLFGMTFAWNSPEVLLIGGAVLMLLLMLLLIWRAAGRSGAMAAVMQLRVQPRISLGRAGWCLRPLRLR